MSIDIKNFLSKSAKNMKKSAIRELLSVANKPEIISFGGGFPNPETFPVEELKIIVQDLLNEKPEVMLQYGTTSGSIPLRTQLVKKYEKDGLKCELDNIIITTASQQAIDLITKTFIDPGDTILCGLPTYLGALQSFNAYRANIVGTKRIEDSEEVIDNLIAEGKKPKFIYAIPDFQNPSGETMNLEQRKKLINIAQKYNIYIIEDSPYKDIRFEGTSYPTMYSLDPERVILLGTFSKTFAPGFRLGWVLASLDVVDRINTSKQTTDLCTSIFNQELAARYIEDGSFDRNLKNTVKLYRKKRDLMLKYLGEFMPKGVSWTHPEGGLFLFVTLPKNLDSKELFKIAIKENVAFVIGEVFFCDGSGQNTLRLNFSYASDDNIKEGVRRLSVSVKKLMEIPK